MEFKRDKRIRRVRRMGLQTHQHGTVILVIGHNLWKEIFDNSYKRFWSLSTQQIGSGSRGRERLIGLKNRHQEKAHLEPMPLKTAQKHFCAVKGRNGPEKLNFPKSTFINLSSLSQYTKFQLPSSIWKSDRRETSFS